MSFKEEAIKTFARKADEAGGIGKTYFERAIQILASIPEQKAEAPKEEAPAWNPVSKNPRRKGEYLVLIDCPAGEWMEVDRYEGRGLWLHEGDDEPHDVTEYVVCWMNLPSKP